MKAIALTSPGNLEMVQIPEPETPSDGILLKTCSVSVCSTDISYFHNHLFSQFYPLILGHEYLGRVVDVGPDCDASLIGKRIVYFGQTDFGGFAEYRALRPLFARDERQSAFRTDRFFHDDERAAAVVIADDISTIEGPLIEPITAVLRAILTNPPAIGSKILILGGGPCGAIAGCILKSLYGVHSIALLEQKQARRETGARNYAEITFSSANELDDFDPGHDTFDYIFDALPPLIDILPEICPRRAAMRSAKPGSKYVIYGASQIPQQFDTWLILAKGITICSAAFDVNHFPMWKTSFVMQTAQNLLRRLIIDASWICTKQLSFDDPEVISSFFHSYREEVALKAVVRFDHD